MPHKEGDASSAQLKVMTVMRLIEQNHVDTSHISWFQKCQLAETLRKHYLEAEVRMLEQRVAYQDRSIKHLEGIIARKLNISKLATLIIGLVVGYIMGVL